MARASTSARDPSAQRALATHLAHGDAILLYDGMCSLCNRFVQFVLRHDQHGSLKFATLQGKFGDGARASLPALAGIDSLILVTPSGAYARSTAALEVMRYLGGPWALALALYMVPRAIRDWAYDQIAKRRYRMFGAYEACPTPDPSVRPRFLD